MRKSSSQRGIHSLFTPKPDRSRRNGALGLVVVSIGTLTWAWALLIFTGSVGTLLPIDRTIESIGLLTTALPVIAIGSTTFAYSHASRRVRDEEGSTGSLAEEVEAFERGRDKPSSLPDIGFRHESSRRKVSGLRIVAFFEGLVIILLYLGLLREYDSSVYMREWVQSNMPLASILLNDNVLFLTIGILLASAGFHLQSKGRTR